MMPVFLVLLSAAVHAFAFPPWNLTVLAWVALVPLLSVLRTLSPGKGFWVGLLWGSAAIWGVAFWVPGALVFYYQQPWWFGVLFCLIGAVILWGSYYALFAAIACWILPRVRGVGGVLLLATWWVTCELARARLLTGEPWMLLGYALVPRVTLIQTADLGGVYLLSFLVMTVNLSIEAGLQRWREGGARPALLSLLPATCLVLLAWGYGAWRVATPLPDHPAVPVTIVQGNNDLGAQWRQEFYGQGLEQYVRLSAAAAQRTAPAVFVWPESAVTFFLAREPRFLAPLTRLLADTGADLIVGAPHYDDADPVRPQFFNSAFYLTADGRLAGRYDKVHLLPFAEYFPLRFIEFLHRRFDRVRAFTPGDGTTLLDTRLGRVAVVICFEAIFPELVRQQMAQGAEVLVNLSNDVWLGARAGPEQHAAMVAVRAVENRTWVVRATTTGVSAIIDPFGRVRARAAPFTPATIDGQIVPLRVDTVYKRYGDMFAEACVVVAAVGIGLLVHRG